MLTDNCAAALPIQWHSPTWRGHFDQISLEDRLIWMRFLDRHHQDYDFVAYDVPVGGSECDTVDAPPALARAWRYCTAKRIDVLALRAAQPTIIEVRYQAGASAVGALLVYAVLYREHNPIGPRPLLRLLSDHMSADTIRAAQHYHIRVDLFPG